MQNLLYTVAIVMLILWAVGFFIYNTGVAIHLLLLIAANAVFLNLIKRKEV